MLLGPGEQSPACLPGTPADAWPDLQVAINGEVLAAMSNINYAAPGGMLDTWMENVQRAGVKNAMVIALDAQTKANAEAKGVTAHEMHIQV
jgi:arabinosyltransferase